MTIRALAAGILLLPTILGAADLTGTVSAVEGTSVRLAIDGDLLPQAGDEVTLRIEDPGLPPVRVGTWKVSRIDGAEVVATLVEATGQPAAGQRATVVSANPQPKTPGPGSSPVARGRTRIRYEGRVYETIYLRKAVNGHKIGVYLFETPAAGDVPARAEPSEQNVRAPQADGEQLWNRFVRDPAADTPGGANAKWWFSQWRYMDDRWRLHHTPGVRVEELAPGAARPGTSEGSVWRITATETGGDRVGFTSQVEFTMTTVAGVTRLEHRSVCMQGRLSGSTLVFTLLDPSGTQVGHGTCVMSGDSLSGSWTNTARGRSGTMKGTRIR